MSENGRTSEHYKSIIEPGVIDSYGHSVQKPDSFSSFLEGSPENSQQTKFTTNKKNTEKFGCEFGGSVFRNAT